jgi:hypothetical protein
MFPVRKVRLALAASALALGLLTGGQALAATDPATQVWEAGGSNMGECSSFLGGMQVRDDVNHIIKDNGDVLGISSPGELFRVRARQQENLPPAQECLQRHLP